MANHKRKTKPAGKSKRKRKAKRLTIKQAMTTVPVPPVEEAVDVIGNLMNETAELYEGMAKIEFATAMHSIAVEIASEEAGFEINEELPSKAIGRLIKGIREKAETTGKTQDSIVIEMLGELNGQGEQLWN